MTLRNRELAALLTVGVMTAIGFATVYIALKSHAERVVVRVVATACVAKPPSTLRPILPGRSCATALKTITPTRKSVTIASASCLSRKRAITCTGTRPQPRLAGGR